MLINQYFISQFYEEDLDEVINSLYSDTVANESFDELEFEERVGAKKSFFLKETARRMLRGIRNGLMLSIESETFEQVGSFVIISVAGELFLIVLTVAGVVFKRLTTGMIVEKVRGTFST
jgi:hypothetical protein